MDNPILIQRPTRRKLGPSPQKETLFLIHDGGGTVFSYFLFDPLDREVHGISNPHFGTNLIWEGGLPNMAQEYAKLIKTVVPSGDILIGGWSLGGMLAIQVAHILSTDPSVRVKGIVMVDSFYPTPALRKRKIKGKWGATTSTDMIQKLERSMDEARRMIANWEPPVWRSETDRSAPVCPPAILIRAEEEDSDAFGENSEEFEEWGRAKGGFAEYQGFNLVQVVDAAGDHFTIFNEVNVEELSVKLKDACDALSRRKSIGV